MTDFQEEVRKLSQETILLPTELANLFERLSGIEVGTRQSLEMVQYALETYIDQTVTALALLNEDQHLVPIRCLNFAEQKQREALADVNRQLREGDHLPTNDEQ